MLGNLNYTQTFWSIFGGVIFGSGLKDKFNFTTSFLMLAVGRQKIEHFFCDFYQRECLTVLTLYESESSNSLPSECLKRKLQQENAKPNNVSAAEPFTETLPRACGDMPAGVIVVIL